ncbi:MAG TPA: hypothetical protein VH741_10560 [Candidatus Limnocylindrales bacterium]|jgi:hypothetical protein
MTRRQPESWLGRRWRQLRSPPPPVLRAVLANLVVAAIGGGLLLVALLGASPASTAPLAALYVLVVIGAGSVLTYLWVELPAGPVGVRRRSPWAALLGLFAGIPIAYLALVLIFEVGLRLLG